jgi:hypothetical protein
MPSLALSITLASQQPALSSIALCHYHWSLSRMIPALQQALEVKIRGALSYIDPVYLRIVTAPEPAGKTMEIS